MRSIQQGDDQIVHLLDLDDVKSAADAEQVAPTRLWAPETTTQALAGEHLDLQCIFAGNPTPAITWRRDGVAVDAETSSRFKITDFGRMLKIRRVKPDDAGSYECVAANAVGSVKTSTQLRIESAPFFHVEPQNLDAAEDETATVICDAGGSPAPEVKLFRNGIPVEEEVPDSRYKVEEGGRKLVIEGLRKVNDVFLVF